MLCSRSRHPTRHHNAGILRPIFIIAITSSILKLAILCRTQIQLQNICNRRDVNGIFLSTFECQPIDPPGLEGQYHWHGADLKLSTHFLMNGAAHGMEGDGHSAAPMSYGAGQGNVVGRKVSTCSRRGMVEHRHTRPRHVQNEGGGDGGGDALLVLVAVDDASGDVVGGILILGKQFEDGMGGDAVVEEISDVIGIVTGGHHVAADGIFYCRWHGIPTALPMRCLALTLSVYRWHYRWIRRLTLALPMDTPADAVGLCGHRWNLFHGASHRR